jgi:hypothetical protein
VINSLHIVLAVAIVLLVPLSRIARARWVPITIGVFFCLLQLLILALGLQANLRENLVAEIEANRAVQHVGTTAGIILYAQMPMRIAAGLAGFGLFVTIICWSGPPSTRRTEEVDKQ